MNKNIKSLFLLTTIVFLLIGVSAVSAADTTSNDTVTTSTVDSQPSEVTSTYASDNSNNDNIISSEKQVVTKSSEKTSVKKDNTNTKTSKKTETKTIKKEDSTNYYVSDSTGSDDNDGSSQDKAFKTIQKAVNLTTSSGVYNIYIGEGTYKGVGNTNLTISGDNTINFIGAGINKTVFDGEAKYDIQYNGFYWGSSPVWYSYVNGSGNWFMNITTGNGKISISNLTMQQGWVKGGSSIAAYKIAPVDNYATLSINNVYFYQNHCGVGTVRNRETGTLYINNSVFDGNRKSDSTGNEGILYNNGTAVVENTIFENNYARWGSVTNDRILKINNCTIRNNYGYDGTSTYKYGSAIATNTGSADFYNPYGMDGLKTEVTNCTFINNDQSDIWQGQGDLLVENNNFINSTGIYISGSKLNMSVSINITNNTFTNVQGSALTVSMTSTAKPAIAIRSVAAGYNLTIEDNVIDAPDTINGKAMDIKGYATIKNNTMNNVINLAGSNVTVINNTVYSVGSYAITETSSNKNNVIANNTLYSAILSGDNAIKASSDTLIGDNLPKSNTYIVTEDNYSDFFDENGIIKTSSVTNGSILLFSGNLTNKNIVFENVKLYIGNNDSALLINSTIATQNNSKVSINGLTFNNYDNQKGYVVLFNTTGNTLNSTTINVETNSTIHAVTLASDDNLVTQSTINVAGPSNNIDWTQTVRFADTIGVVIIGNNNYLNSSTINVKAQPNGQSWGTVDGVDIQSTSSDLTSNTVIYNTHINVEGDQYAYALNVQNAQDISTSMTYFNATSNNYACGIQVTGAAVNNTIAGYVYANAPVMAYGAYITSMGAGGVVNTNLTKLYIQNVTAPYATGVTIEGVANTTVSDATYNVYGDKVTGLELSNTENVTANKLTVITYNTNENSTLVSLNQATNANITNNRFTTDNGKGVLVFNSTNDNITNNYININNILSGDEAVELNISEDIIVANNIPKSIIISDDTYDLYFDENSTLNVSADIISIGDKLTNKVLYMNTNASFYNPYDTTMYNTTFAFIGNNTRDVYMYGLKFDNTNKTAIIINSTANSKRLYFLNGFINASGDNLTVINKISSNSVYFQFRNSEAIVNSDSSATFFSYTAGSSYIPEISYSDITVNAKEVSKVVQAIGSCSIYFNHNNIYQTGDIISTINGSIKTEYTDGFSYNNITAVGNNVALITIDSGSSAQDRIIYNNINITSTNPVTVINITSAKYALVNNNVIIVNANNNDLPLISINSSNPDISWWGSTQYTDVSKNYIQSLDVVGNSAAVVTNGTVYNNIPLADSQYETIITVETVDTTKINNTITIYVTYTDVFGNPITGNITVKADDEVVGTLTESGSITAALPENKNYTITVESNATEKYNANSVETTVEVFKLNTITTANPVTGTLKELVDFTATVVDENGDNVNGGYVVFYINGELLTDAKGNVLYATVNNGTAKVSVKSINAWLKDTNVTAEYLGNDVYEASDVSDNATVTIDLRTPTVTILTDKTTLKAGEKILIIVHVTDGDKVVNQGRVAFKLNGITLKDSEGNPIIVKVVNGIATLEYTIPKGYSAKSYNLTVVYGGSDYSRGEENSTITLVKTNTHIDANIVETSNGTSMIKISVLDQDNNPLARDTKVTVKVNGITIHSAVVAENGTAYLDLGSIRKAGNYNITVISGENNAYESSARNITYIKGSTQIKTHVNATITTPVDNKASVAVKIYDNDNNLVTGNTKVSVKVNGITQLSNQVATNGVLDVNITTPNKTGDNILTVIAGETSIYASSTQNVTFKVE